VENKFPGVKIDKYVVMPNHFHAIIELLGHEGEGGHAGPPLRGPTVSAVIDWFKTMTTNEYIRGVKDGLYPRFDKRMWQRNYYEHVIRGEADYRQIWQYIDENPQKWAEDCYYRQ